MTRADQASRFSVSFAAIPSVNVTPRVATRHRGRSRGHAPSGGAYRARRSGSGWIAPGHTAPISVPYNPLPAVRQDLFGMLRDEGVGLGSLHHRQHPARPVPGDLCQRAIHRFRLTQGDDVAIALHGVSFLPEVLEGFDTRHETPPSQTPSPISRHSSGTGPGWSDPVFLGGLLLLPTRYCRSTQQFALQDAAMSAPYIVWVRGLAPARRAGT